MYKAFLLVFISVLNHENILSSHKNTPLWNDLRIYIEYKNFKKNMPEEQDKKIISFNRCLPYKYKNKYAHLSHKAMLYNVIYNEVFENITKNINSIDLIPEDKKNTSYKEVVEYIESKDFLCMLQAKYSDLINKTNM